MRTTAMLQEMAEQAIDNARTVIVSRRPETITPKTDRDFVTDIDYEVEQRTREHLSRAAPDIGFLGEEEGATATRTGNAYWAFDPVDGTSNLAHGLPLCGCSLGLIVDGVPVLGIIDLPFLDERFIAARGQGAYLNGQRIHASTTHGLSAAIIAIGDYAVGPGADDKNLPRLAMTAALASTVERIRMFGSAAIDLAWTAAGRIDGSVMLANKPWDVAAGAVIAREAGAHVLDLDGSEHGLESMATISAAPGIRKKLADLVRNAVELDHIDPPQP